jgi:hypothetical protein
MNFHTITSMGLPQDIQGVIVDHLHADLNALQSSALVCKAWLPPARRRIFSSLTLHFVPSFDGHVYVPVPIGFKCPERIVALTDLFTTKPEIAAQVRTLRMCIYVDKDMHPPWRMREGAQELLKGVVAPLKSIHQLDLCKIYWIMGASTPYSAIPDSMFAVINDILSLPSLQFLRLSQFTMNAAGVERLLNQCFHIQGLALHYIGTDLKTDVEEMKHVEKALDESLGLDFLIALGSGINGPFAELLAPFMKSTKELAFVKPQTWFKEPDLVRMSKLEHIYLASYREDNSGERSSSTIDRLSRLTCLRTSMQGQPMTCQEIQICVPSAYLVLIKLILGHPWIGYY